MEKEPMLKLSPRHRLNPSMERCWGCGENIGILLMGQIDEQDSKAPREVMTGNFCNKCKSVMNDGGLIIIETKDNKCNSPQDRTGRMVAVSKSYKERLQDMAKDVQLKNWCYMEKSVFSALFDEALATNTNKN